MRLTETTQVKLLTNGFVAVYEGTNPATLFRQDAMRPCQWLVPWNTEDGPTARPCGVPVVDFDNGFRCLAGHDHYEYGTYEYFDDDEIASAAHAGRTLPVNARRMDGGLV